MRTSSDVDVQNVGHVSVASAGCTVWKPCAGFVRGWKLNGNLLSLWFREVPACQAARPGRIWGGPGGERRLSQPLSHKVLIVGLLPRLPQMWLRGMLLCSSGSVQCARTPRAVSKEPMSRAMPGQMMPRLSLPVSAWGLTGWQRPHAGDAPAHGAKCVLRGIGKSSEGAAVAVRLICGRRSARQAY